MFPKLQSRPLSASMEHICEPHLCKIRLLVAGLPLRLYAAYELVIEGRICTYQLRTRVNESAMM